MPAQPSWEKSRSCQHQNRSCLKEEVLGECLGSKGTVRAAVPRPQVEGRGQEASGGVPVSPMCLRTSNLLRSPQCMAVLGRRVQDLGRAWRWRAT